MTEPKAPCKDCKDRHIGCHSTCDKYLQFTTKQKEYKQFIAKCKEQEVTLDRRKRR